MMMETPDRTTQPSSMEKDAIGTTVMMTPSTTASTATTFWTTPASASTSTPTTPITPITQVLKFSSTLVL